MSRDPYAWRKLSAADTEDAWHERLSDFADRLAITALAGKPTIRVEVFALKRTEAERLKKRFGGATRQQSLRGLVMETRSKPINIRGRLRVVPDDAQRGDDAAGVPALIIPAGMAFGTGEHATTLNCLRFLVDAAGAKQEGWSMLDLGCGTGILALAAKVLGAEPVIAADFDSECIRVTRENCRTNALRGVTIRRLDVLEWEPEATFDVVCANLYSSILVQIAPKLAQSVAPGGTLIFSGVMREQEREVVTAFRKAGLRVTQTKHQGKWVAGMAALKA